ncbi:MAG: 3-keto-5-aminohexanoate cleavage protein [Polaromonas sp.]|nr:3-keto-5-aminohexanoate cleavage protein [Polaromonas sp.]
MSKVIIACAVAGAIRTPSMSAYLTVALEKIIEASIGAAIIRLHACDPVSGKPDQRPAAFTKFLPQIKQKTDAVLALTSGPTRMPGSFRFFNHKECVQ